MQGLTHFFKEYPTIKDVMMSSPKRSALIILFQFFAGLMEGLSLAALLPLLSFLFDSQSSTPSQLSIYVGAFYDTIGVEPNLIVILATIVILIAFKGVMTYLSLLQIGYIGQEVGAQLRKEFIKNLFSVKWVYFTSRQLGDITSVLTTQIERARTIYDAIGKTVSSLIEVVIFLYIAFILSPSLMLSALLCGTAIMLVLARFVKLTRISSTKELQETSHFLSGFVDAASGYKSIKSMAIEKKILGHFNKTIDQIREYGKRTLLFTSLVSSLQEPLQVILICVGIYFAIGVLNYPVELLIVMAVLFYRAIQRITIVQKHYHVIINSSPFYNSIKNANIELLQNLEKNAGGTKQTLQKQLSLVDVSFSYGKRLVLDRLSLDIPRGQFVVLVGPSGVGKTTLCDLLLGLYQPASGQVLLDGVPLAEMDLHFWREQIGYVSQQTFLFNDTIKNNITFKDQKYSDTDVIQALKYAGLYEHVTSLEETIHAGVGERGGRLSGGQQQRLAIARALIRKPRLLILDESTTGLDKETEAGIIQTLNSLKGDVTIIAISHQHALRYAADRVIELGNCGFQEVNRGDVVESFEAVV